MAASHDASQREANTTSNATQTNIAASEASQTVAQVTSGRGNKVIGAGANSGNVSAGRDLTVNSLDPATIAGAFGLTTDVVNQLAALAGGYVDNATDLSEHSQAMVSEAFDRFGSDLSAVTAKQIDANTPGSGNDKIIITAVIVGGVIAAATLFRPRK